MLEIQILKEKLWKSFVFSSKLSNFVLTIKKIKRP